MAPVIDAYPNVSRTYATMTATTTPSTAFVAITLGRSANAIELSVPPAPAVHAAGDLKARSYDFLADLLTPHAAHYSSAKLFAAFAGHIPTSAYNATLEADGICLVLRSSFFLIDHLTALGFRDHLGDPISQAITADITTRPPGITYFAFRSTIHPATIDARISIPSHSFEFWLALPQTVLGGPTIPNPSAVSTARKKLDFATPARTPGPSSNLLTAADIHAMDGTTQAALGTATSTDIMSDYAPDCFALFTAEQIQTLVLRSASAATAATISVLPALSPKMTAVLAATHTSSSSYFGSLGFLDSQVVFDSVFPNPVPLLVTPSPHGATVDSTSLLKGLLAFVDCCKFTLFVPIFRCDYVGTADRDDAASLHATIHALKRPSMSYRNPTSGHWINLTPDELFAAYAELTPLLPNNVSLWGLNLVTQYHDALSHDIQEALQNDPS